MSPMTGPCSAAGSRRLARAGIGFDGQLGGGRGGAEKSLLGRALLVAQAVFEPGIFFFEAVNLLLLFQAVRAIAESVKARG